MKILHFKKLFNILSIKNIFKLIYDVFIIFVINIIIEKIRNEDKDNNELKLIEENPLIWIQKEYKINSLSCFYLKISILYSCQIRRKI